MKAADMTGLEEVIVIGGGPAGLALGFELKQRNISFVILERGETAASSWRAMPTRMKLLSPWKAMRLPGSNGGTFRANAEISRAEYDTWLRSYAEENALPIVTGVEVSGASRSEDGTFEVQTNGGSFSSRLLVNATGYFSEPLTPTFPGARESVIRQFHFADYKDADALRRHVGKKNPLVLVVGKRLSAGQTIVELAEAGCSVALSHRGELSFGSGPAAWWFFFRLHPWMEAMKLKWQGARARGVEIRMQGGKPKRLIESGVVRVFPEIEAFEKAAVLFRNGERLEPDAVIYATGFRPAFRHLSSLNLRLDERTGQPALEGMESREVPGLFFLGLDGLRNFQSRFIRGIRNDAAVLAQRIRERLHAHATIGKQAEASLADVP
jgi:putative flavoprotein involved in K+ transport